MTFKRNFSRVGVIICSDITYRTVIDSTYANIVNVQRETAELSYEFRRRGGGYVAHWNRDVIEAHRAARVSDVEFAWYTALGSCTG